MIDLNKRAQEVHKQNSRWWHDLETGERLDRNKGELLMLVISELAEAMEGERKDLMDTHLPHRKMAEVEMADAYIRLLDYAAGFGYDLDFTSTAWGSFVNNKGEGLLEIVKAITEFATYDNGTSPGLLWDVFDAISAYCDKHDYDLEGAYQEKMTYNATRHDHSAEARKQPNGKKW